MIFSGIINAVGSVASTFMEGQVAKSKAKANVMVAEAEAKAEIMRTAATHDAKGELLTATGSPDSWKDEAWTILFIALIIACFIPGLAPHIERGFQVLENSTPDWFEVAIYISISASFGLRGFSKFINKK